MPFVAIKVTDKNINKLYFNFMKQKLFAALVVMLSVTTFAFAQTKQYGHGLQEYKLDNGLTVFLCEDPDASSVHGRVVCRAGAVDEPAEFTGLAHYLEHVLFKGTDKIGALDWEKEKPLYEEIIRLYDELTAEKDEAKRLELIKAINEKSLEAAQYGATNDFSNLTEGYGGDGLNAFTSYDLTAYFNDFPASAMEKWLELNSERLLNPIFRAFQAELENVFEEYNMYQDELSTHQRVALFSKIYKGNPYERDVIGYPEHLKNPSLSALINFFKTWYVPNNMALILVGNFDAEATKPLIAEKFGRLVPKELPERPTHPRADFTGNKKYSEKMGYMPSIEWIFKGATQTSEDQIVLDFMLSLLNNSHATGLLDRLMLDGTVSSAYVSADSRRIDGCILVSGVPYYDMQQRRFESDAQTKKLIFAEIDKIKNNQVPEWLFNSVKEQHLQQYKLMFEDMGSMVNILTYAYAYGQPVDYYLKQDEAIRAIKMEDVVACAKKYFNDTYMTISFTEGDPKKNKLAKPQIKPLDPPKGVQTPYGKAFEQIPVTPTKDVYNDMSEVTVKDMFKNVTLHYTPNTKNDVFTLTLKYGVGTHKMPKLSYAASLMTTAGMLPNLSAQEVRRQYSELGASVSYGASESYFYIQVVGEEKNLDAILSLITKHVMMPNLDDKQIRSMVSNSYWSRYSEKRNPSTVSSALLEYVLYGENSHYIDRIPMEELYKYSVMDDGTVIENFLINKTNLTTTIQEATGYKVDAYYCGAKPLAEVEQSLKAIPMQENMRDTESPYFRDRAKYEKTNVMFLNDSKMQQAKVYFYLNSNRYEIKDDVALDAFNQYFSGGFSGLVMNEIREKRSMAYTAYGMMSQGQKPGRDMYLFGYVGTQGDKVADAVDVFMGLLNDMPNDDTRMQNIKTFLRQSALAAKPSMRSKAQVYEAWRELGYNDDPARVNMTAIENLSYDDIRNFYEKNVKGQPITIVIIGDKKSIDLKAIKAKYGKIQNVSSNKLFKGGI